MVAWPVPGAKWIRAARLGVVEVEALVDQGLGGGGGDIAVDGDVDVINRGAEAFGPPPMRLEHDAEGVGDRLLRLQVRVAAREDARELRGQAEPGAQRLVIEVKLLALAWKLS